MILQSSWWFIDMLFCVWWNPQNCRKFFFTTFYVGRLTYTISFRLSSFFGVVIALWNRHLHAWKNPIKCDETIPYAWWSKINNYRIKSIDMYIVCYIEIEIKIENCKWQEFPKTKKNVAPKCVCVCDDTSGQILPKNKFD